MKTRKQEWFPMHLVKSYWLPIIIPEDSYGQYVLSNQTTPAYFIFNLPDGSVIKTTDDIPLSIFDTDGDTITSPLQVTDYNIAGLTNTLLPLRLTHQVLGFQWMDYQVILQSDIPQIVMMAAGGLFLVEPEIYAEWFTELPAG